MRGRCRCSRCSGGPKNHSLGVRPGRRVVNQPRSAVVAAVAGVTSARVPNNRRFIPNVSQVMRIDARSKLQFQMFNKTSIDAPDTGAIVRRCRVQLAAVESPQFFNRATWVTRLRRPTNNGNPTYRRDRSEESLRYPQIGANRVPGRTSLIETVTSARPSSGGVFWHAALGRS